MIKTKSVQMIDVSDWDNLVTSTYGRPYNFQQQDGCKERGTIELTVPDEAYDFEDETPPEEVNGDDMGVSFAAWLARDPKQPLVSICEWDRKHGLELFWTRNFYPDVQMIANDLHEKGLLPAGDYVIDIDW